MHHVLCVARPMRRHILAMMLRSLLPLCSALLFAVGCGPRASGLPTVNLQSGARVTATDNSDRGEILLWAMKGSREQIRTFRIAAEGSLSVLGEYDGIRIATSRGELQWQAQEKELDLKGCEHFDGSPAAPTKGLMTTANLLNSNGEVVQKIVESSGEPTDVDDVQHHVALMGTIGPYLFIQEDAFVYACGAHGNTMVSAMIWDAESGKTINIWGELPDRDKLAEAAKRKLDETDEIERGQDEESSIPEPAQFLPTYGERGALHLEAQFARFACYACSDGLWSSYTQSAMVPTEWMPERMKAWVTPPVVVKDFMESHREWQLGGWSRR